MKVLVLGGGGREHALVWKLRQSARVRQVVCAPGNAGIAALARCVPIDPASVPAVVALVEQEQPELVVIGPEAPLAAGVVDRLEMLGVRVFGPTMAAAQLETSKSFAKRFMRRRGIPTARSAVCEAANRRWDEVSDLVRGALDKFPGRVVVKADGLASGKGVILCESHAEAVHAAEGLFTGRLLGTAVQSVVIEEMLVGPEVSYFAICDGQRATTLAFAQDHKRIGEGDTGANTGGMGACCTDTLVTPEQALWLQQNIAQRVVDGMRAEGSPFRGVLFTGLMMTADGPKVLEFNTRFGDPETEAILLRLETELCDLLEAAVDGRIDSLAVQLSPGASACVMAASGGYPGPYHSGLPITLPQTLPEGVQIFHAGTSFNEDRLSTAGGRVLAVSASAASLEQAMTEIYSVLGQVTFEGMQYRRDIGAALLARR